MEKKNYVAKPLVILAHNLSQIGTLVEDLKSRANLVVLNSQQNGIAQITQALEKYQNFSSLHLISHGSPGCLYLGNEPLNIENITEHKEQLNLWQQFLAGKDFLIYGCQVAKEKGATFLKQLSQFTGSKIAASREIIGSTESGSYWNLEFRLGNAISSDVIFSTALQASYNGAFIAVGETSDFEDGSTQGWTVGNAGGHPAPPTNISDGGPDGAEDNFLQTESFGGSGAGSRLAWFNSSSAWTGNYTEEGVTAISASVINQGSSDVVLRVAFDGAGGRFVTTEGITISPGADWQDVTFDITASDLTAAGGSDVDATLSNVSAIRFLNNADAGFQGAAVAAQVGIDNITAISEATTGDLPIVSLTIDQEAVSEEDAPLTTNFTFNVEGEIPEGGLPVLFGGNITDLVEILDQLDGNFPQELIGLESLGFFPAQAAVGLNILEDGATLTRTIANDIVEEADRTFFFSVVPNDQGVLDSEYIVSAENGSDTLTLTDDNGGPGVGPTVGLSVDQTELTENQEFTISFSVAGEIPDGGLPVLVNGSVEGGLGEFNIFNEDGSPAFTSSGIEGIPVVGDDRGSSFIAVLTENDASITISTFDDGPNEGLEEFSFSLANGEEYEVDPNAAEVTLSIDDGGTGLPVVSITTTTPIVSEDSDNPVLDFTFTVDGEIPEGEQGLPIVIGGDIGPLFLEPGILDGNFPFVIEPADGIIPIDLGGTEFTVGLTSPSVTISLTIFDDIIEEEPRVFDLAVLEGEGYIIDQDIASITIEDGPSVTPGSGPTVNLSVSETDLEEGDELTVNFDIDGEIPDDGVEVFLAGGPTALGEFNIFNEDGSPAIALVGIDEFPIQGGDDGGFFVTLNENQASITLSVFEDGPGEGEEILPFELVDGELYEVDEANSTVDLTINDTPEGTAIISIDVQPDVVSEEGDTTFFEFVLNVDGEIPTPVFDDEGNLISGGLPFFFDGSIGGALFSEIVGAPIIEGFTFGSTVNPANGGLEFILLEDGATSGFNIFNDIIEENDEITFSIFNDDDGLLNSNYVVNPDASSATITILDDNGGPGVGPTVSLSVSDTELNEGDEVTVNFDVEGEIPEGGVQVFIAGGPTDIGEFNIFNEDGSPAIALEGIDEFPLQGGDEGGFFVTLAENQASITLSVFEDGPTEGSEALTFELGNGELYEVNPDAGTVILNIDDGGEDASFDVESGVTSVFLDLPLLEEAAGLTLVSVDSDTTPSDRPAFLDPFQVGFAIAEETDFSFAPVPFTPLSGTIEHSGTITLALGDAEVTVGEFSIGFDGSRVSETTSGFFVADTLEDALGLEVLFDLSAPGTVNISGGDLEISDADLLLAPELATALGLPDLAGADVGDAQIDALYTSLTEELNLLDTPFTRFQNSEIPGTYVYATGAEADSIRDNLPGFIEEGVAFSAAIAPNDELIALNRLESNQLPGTFLYVGDEELASINADPNFSNAFTNQGVAFYVYGVGAGVETPFNRFQNTDVPGTYLFATGAEADAIRSDFPGFVDEGVAFEALI